MIKYKLEKDFEKIVYPPGVTNINFRFVGKPKKDGIIYSEKDERGKDVWFCFTNCRETLLQDYISHGRARKNLLILIASTGERRSKEAFALAMKFLKIVENEKGWEHSKLYTVKANEENKKIVFKLLVLNKEWMDQTHLLSLAMGVLRAGYRIEKLNNEKDTNSIKRVKSLKGLLKELKKGTIRETHDITFLREQGMNAFIPVFKKELLYKGMSKNQDNCDEGIEALCQGTVLYTKLNKRFQKLKMEN